MIQSPLPILAVLVALAMIGAGCVGPTGDDSADDGPTTRPAPSDPTPTEDPFRPHRPVGNQGPFLVNGTLHDIQFSALRTGFLGAEPTLGVTTNHNVFITAGTQAVRSTDNGGNWSVVSTPVSAPTSFDPYLWVDQDTDRVFHANLYVASTYLAISDDYGDSWVVLPAAGGPGDHQKLTTGPPSPSNPAAGVAYPNVVYYAVNLLSHTEISVSYDGGATWPQQPAGVPFACGSGGINGQPHGAPSGTAFVPYYDCGGLWTARSTDNGLSWSTSEIDGGLGAGIFDPDMASDRAGNVYAAWMAGSAGNHSVVLAASTDDGVSWGDPVRIPEADLGTAFFPTVVAGDEGKLWVAYYATANTTKHPNDAAEDTEWYLYAAFVEDADTDQPNVVNFLLDPHPVQIGRICTEGVNCNVEGGEASDTRNLLEFIDSAVDAETGRLWIVYTDGCDVQCTTQAESDGRTSSVARLDSGPSVFDDVEWLEPFPQP